MAQGGHRGGEGNRPYDLWALTAPFTTLRRLTDANPQLASKDLGATSLLTYLDADGKPEFGIVHYPRGYEKGKIDCPSDVETDKGATFSCKVTGIPGADQIEYKVIDDDGNVEVVPAQ